MEEENYINNINDILEYVDNTTMIIQNYRILELEKKRKQSLKNGTIYNWLDEWYSDDCDKSNR